MGTAEALLREALTFCLDKVGELRQVRDFPYATRAGRWQTVRPDETDYMPAHGSWTVGFTPGLFWLAYAVTGREEYGREALARCRRFTHRADDRTTHDLGFIFYPSYVLGYRLTGESWLREVALKAASTLAGRFNHRGCFLRAWGPPESEDHAGETTIDAMMNLMLLYWAAEAGGNPEFARVATAHAETSARTLVRPDGSTYHVYVFDPRSGQPLAGRTHQGYADWSTWSRGQAWGIYGFAHAAARTGRPDFLETAKRLADYFLGRLPADLVPFWDFDDPAIPEAPRDSSAGAIAACGLLELAAVVSPADAERYREAAVRLIGALYVQASSRGQPGRDGILLNGTWHRRAGFAVGESLIFGDYYFTEAVVRLLGVKLTREGGFGHV